MKYIDQIAYSLERRDEVPNQELARKLADEKNHEGIQEMVEYLYDKNQSIASDCIKVIYETGYIAPELIAPYTEVFLQLLHSKHSRMVWGGMIALSGAAKVVPEKVIAELDLILDKIKTGSVITNVAGVKTVINLSIADKKYYSKLKPILFELQAKCRPIDFAKRAEDMIGVIDEADLDAYIAILEERKPSLTNAAQKRLEKLLRKYR
ncbi:MAG: hypothetical protein KAQ68_09115 [Clostridiales bacterium]|nr:hypothetical protein [Clostridiales bacterium]